MFYLFRYKSTMPDPPQGDPDNAAQYWSNAERLHESCRVEVIYGQQQEDIVRQLSAPDKVQADLDIMLVGAEYGIVLRYEIDPEILA
jgi:hypothetical protein